MFLFRDFVLNIEKEITVSLLSIYGLGRRKAVYIISRLGLMQNMPLGNINPYIFNLMTFLLKSLVMSQVRILRDIELNITRKKDNSSYAGFRHKYCLPVRGQRTRTNAGTQRSKRIKIDSLNATQE